MSKPKEVGLTTDQGSRLSMMVSEWHKIHMDEIECHADVDMWYAPSECHGDVANSFDKERKRFFEKWGTSHTEFRADVIQRVGHKYAHFHLFL